MPNTRTKKTPPEPKLAAKKTVGAAHNSGRAKVRMYRQGLGDCFLITLPRKDGTPFFMLIDCGVILGTPDAKSKMIDVLNDISAVTKHIDLLVITHEHWDHLSGFLQAQSQFDKIQIDQAWFAWTEDPKDALANKLRDEHANLRMALAGAAARCQMAANPEASKSIDEFLGFFGAAGQGTTTDALNYVKKKVAKQIFCRPTDPPIVVPDVDARFFVLGPPHDEAMIKRFNPSKSAPETYGLDSTNRFLLDSLRSTIDVEQAGPFDSQFQIPVVVAQQLKFFHDHYWGEDPDAADPIVGPPPAGDLKPTLDQSWRRIDSDWLGVASELALQLDSATNNTSLALAIELGGGDVLLFAADAQVGNWLSWQDLTWQIEGKTVTGPELLAQTLLYKVGHHGSHNATLKKLGLELMNHLKIAVIPVDHDMAVTKRWGNMPLPELVTALEAATGGFVLRVDKPVPAKYASQVKATDLYYEVTV